MDESLLALGSAGVELKNLFLDYLNQVRREKQAKNDAGADVDVRQGRDDDGIDQQLQRNARKRGGSEDFTALRKRLRVAKTIQDQIEVLNLLDEARKPYGPNITEGARKFVHSTLTPILSCLRNHFNNDLAAFIARWPTITPSKFRKNNCNGKSATCRL